MWPVVGDDLKKALGTFLKSRLKLENAFLVDMGDVSVKKIVVGPRSKIKGKVIAVFSIVWPSGTPSEAWSESLGEIRMRAFVLRYCMAYKVI